MVTKDESGKSIQDPGLILNDKTEVKRFIKALKRNKSHRARQQEFDSEDFSLKNYMNELSDYKVKIDLPDHFND